MKLPSTIGITGVAGFVGANLSERLLAEGCAVVGVDDMSAGSMYNVAPFLDNPGFEMHEFDCRDVKRLRREFAGCDAIVHLAALKIPRYGGALRTLEVNVDGSHAVFDVAMSTGAHVVMASTSDVYGNAVPPFAEEDPIVLGPPTSVRWSYATSKLFDEHLALRLSEERDLRVTILRLFNAYGPRNHPTWWGGPLSLFFEEMMDGKTIELHGDGRQVRSFTYVSDTVDGFVRSLERPETSGEIINIGAEEPISIVKLAERVQGSLGIAGPLRATLLPFERMPGKYQDVRVRIPDTTKARQMLGFEAQVPLDEGLRRTVAWVRERRAAESAAEAEVA
jgi:UDP-glucose 4-epimerase